MARLLGNDGHKVSLFFQPYGWVLIQSVSSEALWFFISEEYREAKAQLDDHAGLVETVYDMATTDIYGSGSCYFGAGARSYLKDIRFCGREWLMERCEKRITKEGY